MNIKLKLKEAESKNIKARRKLMDHIEHKFSMMILKTAVVLVILYVVFKTVR